jgi:hypothetical protein
MFFSGVFRTVQKLRAEKTVSLRAFPSFPTTVTTTHLCDSDISNIGLDVNINCKNEYVFLRHTQQKVWARIQITQHYYRLILPLLPFFRYFLKIK